ncbi:MAG TPA: hypothetical protein VFW84_07780 [Aquabacterium sp.]|nr:hypothetical protein [Aquabacterium sp.]HEX5372619.1 hypothetical protein [Aquabacterium sp.]
MRKLLQNTLFAAMTAWALHGMQAHVVDSAPAHTAAPMALASGHWQY